MAPPLGYIRADSTQVCWLKKSLYSLKQACRQWNHELTRFLLQDGFKQSVNRYLIFIKGSGLDFLVVLFYVDDILLTGPSMDAIVALKHKLDLDFTIKDLGKARFFLGLELCCNLEGILLHQRKYVLDLLVESGLTSCKPANTPFALGCKLDKDSRELLANLTFHRRTVGHLLYLGLTRSHIC